MSKQFSVCAVFGERRSMKAAVMYAGRLTALLNAGELHIYLPGAGKDDVEPRLTSGSAAEMQRERVKEIVSQWQPSPVVVHDEFDLATAHPALLPANALVVSNDLALKRRDLTILQPVEETHVLRASGSILVPFGDGDLAWLPPGPPCHWRNRSALMWFSITPPGATKPCSRTTRLRICTRLLARTMNGCSRWQMKPGLAIRWPLKWRAMSCTACCVALSMDRLRLTTRIRSI